MELISIPADRDGLSRAFRCRGGCHRDEIPPVQSGAIAKTLLLRQRSTRAPALLCPSPTFAHMRHKALIYNASLPYQYTVPWHHCRAAGYPARGQGRDRGATETHNSPKALRGRRRDPRTGCARLIEARSSPRQSGPTAGATGRKGFRSSPN